MVTYTRVTCSRRCAAALSVMQGDSPAVPRREKPRREPLAALIFDRGRAVQRPGTPGLVGLVMIDCDPGCSCTGRSTWSAPTEIVNAPLDGRAYGGSCPSSSSLGMW